MVEHIEYRLHLSPLRLRRCDFASGFGIPYPQSCRLATCVEEIGSCDKCRTFNAFQDWYDRFRLPRLDIPEDRSLVPARGQQQIQVGRIVEAANDRGMRV